MEGRRPEGHITCSRNKRMEKTSRRQRRMEVSSEGGQDPEGGSSAIDKMEIYLLLWLRLPLGRKGKKKIYLG